MARVHSRDQHDTRLPLTAPAGGNDRLPTEGRDAGQGAWAAKDRAVINRQLPWARAGQIGLPERNEDFGRKVITVKAGGQTDTLSVEVFFDPASKNHPGDGTGQTPNWFYYRGKTSAGKGFTDFYMEEIPPCIDSEDVLLGRYVYDDDKVYLAGALVRSRCPARSADEAGSTGIACYAAILRHETTHQREQMYWWPVEKNHLKFEPHACSWGGTNLTAAANFYAEVDSDLDGVPDYIERALTQTRGCNAMKKMSCSGRPSHLSRAVSDNEMNAYTEGWRWVLTSADEEDWPRCGKQWVDARVCPGGKIW